MKQITSHLWKSNDFCSEWCTLWARQWKTYTSVIWLFFFCFCFFSLPAMSTISSSRKKSIQSYPKTGLVKREERDKNISLINSVAFWKRCTNTAFQPKSDKGNSYLISLTSKHKDVLFSVLIYEKLDLHLSAHVCMTNSEMWISARFQVRILWHFSK